LPMRNADTTPPKLPSAPLDKHRGTLGFLDAVECGKIVMERLNAPSATKSRPERVLDGMAENHTDRRCSLQHKGNLGSGGGTRTHGKRINSPLHTHIAVRRSQGISADSLVAQGFLPVSSFQRFPSFRTLSRPIRALYAPSTPHSADHAKACRNAQIAETQE
jgi:hypothetical protein